MGVYLLAGDPDIVATFTSAITSAKGDILGVFGVVIVAAVAIAGVRTAGKAGINMIKSLMG